MRRPRWSRSVSPCVSKVVVINNLTLDGVMQAPGRPDEDTRRGFEHGGWARMPNEDPDIGRAMAGRMARSGPLLLGRRTHDGGPFAALRLVDALTTATGVVISTYQSTEPA
jgi:hypothetical protein